MFAYIGVEGYALHTELRAGSDHCQKKAFRRRIKTVIQTMITFASRLVYHARRYYLHFGKDNP